MFVSEIGKERPVVDKNSTECKVLDRLDKLKIDYDILTSDPAHTMEQCINVDKKLGVTVWKSIFLCNQKKSSFYLLVMPPFKEVDTKVLEKRIGIKLSFASEENMVKHLGTRPGSATVMAIINDLDDYVQVLVDKEVMGSDMFGCNPGINTIHLRLKTSDVMNKYIPSTHHRIKIIEL